MGCGSSKAADVTEPPAARAQAPDSAATNAEPASNATSAAAVAPPAGSTAASPGDANVSGAPAADNAPDQAKQITKQAFEDAMVKLLTGAIEGYPRALRSTLSRRNELLRQTSGNQDAAAEIIKAEAGKMTQEGKTWLLGLVPYVGLPASVIYPSWLMLRRVCLLAGVFGLDLAAEKTRAKILHAFAGLRAVPAAEYAVEMAVQAVWLTFAGPVAGMIPVGTLVSKVTNIEGVVVDTVGRETFVEDRRPVPEAEYQKELDPEPTPYDYLELAKEGTAAALYAAWRGVLEGKDIALDGQRRSDAALSALQAGQTAAGTAVMVGAGTAMIAADLGQQAFTQGQQVGQQALAQGQQVGQQAFAQGQQALGQGQQALAGILKGAQPQAEAPTGKLK